MRKKKVSVRKKVPMRKSSLKEKEKKSSTRTPASWKVISDRSREYFISMMDVLMPAALEHIRMSQRGFASHVLGGLRDRVAARLEEDVFPTKGSIIPTDKTRSAESREQMERAILDNQQQLASLKKELTQTEKELAEMHREREEFTRGVEEMEKTLRMLGQDLHPVFRDTSVPLPDESLVRFVEGKTFPNVGEDDDVEKQKGSLCRRLLRVENNIDPSRESISGLFRLHQQLASYMESVE